MKRLTAAAITLLLSHAALAQAPQPAAPAPPPAAPAPPAAEAEPMPQPDLDPATLEQDCNAGNEGACRVLADAYIGGHAVPRNLERAVELYGQACTQRDALACFRLGEIRANGLVGHPDKEAAGRLYLAACQLGHQPACDRVTVVAAPAPIAVGQVMVPVEDAGYDFAFHGEGGLSQLRPVPVSFPSAGVLMASVGVLASKSQRRASLAAAFDFGAGMSDDGDLIFDVRLAVGGSFRAGPLRVIPMVGAGADAVGATGHTSLRYKLPSAAYLDLEGRALLSVAGGRALVFGGGSYRPRAKGNNETALELGGGWHSGGDLLALTLRATDFDGALLVGLYFSFTRTRHL